MPRLDRKGRGRDRLRVHGIHLLLREPARFRYRRQIRRRLLPHLTVRAADDGSFLAHPYTGPQYLPLDMGVGEMLPSGNT